MGPFGLLAPGWSQTRLQRRWFQPKPILCCLLGPIIVVIPVFLSYLIVPFGQNLVITNVNQVFYGLHYLAFSRLA